MSSFAKAKSTGQGSDTATGRGVVGLGWVRPLSKAPLYLFFPELLKSSTCDKNIPEIPFLLSLSRFVGYRKSLKASIAQMFIIMIEMNVTSTEIYQ